MVYSLFLAKWSFYITQLVLPSISKYSRIHLQWLKSRFAFYLCVWVKMNMHNSNIRAIMLKIILSSIVWQWSRLLNNSHWHNSRLYLVLFKQKSIRRKTQIQQHGLILFVPNHMVWKFIVYIFTTLHNIFIKPQVKNTTELNNPTHLADLHLMSASGEVDDDWWYHSMSRPIHGI